MFKGSSATVRLAENKITGEIFAVKIIRTNDEEFSLIIKKEYSIIKGLNHKNIIKAEKLVVEPKSAAIYIVLEYFKGQTLKEFVEENGPQS